MIGTDNVSSHKFAESMAQYVNSGLYAFGECILLCKARPVLMSLSRYGMLPAISFLICDLMRFKG